WKKSAGKMNMMNMRPGRIELLVAPKKYETNRPSHDIAKPTSCIFLPRSGQYANPPSQWAGVYERSKKDPSRHRSVFVRFYRSTRKNDFCHRDCPVKPLFRPEVCLSVSSADREPWKSGRSLYARAPGQRPAW